MVAAQASGLREQAGQAFTACAQKAAELDVIEPFVAACVKRAPLEKPPATPSATGPSASSTPEIAKARTELLAKGPDAEALETLGLAQLAAGDLRRARLTFQRTLELSDVRASAHAALGVALARLGESAQARDAYRHALSLDPTLDRAHAGLAALYCRFGALEKGRAELGRARNAPAPNAADADPELAKCGGAR